MSHRPYYSLQVARCIGCRKPLGRAYCSSGHFKPNEVTTGQAQNPMITASWHERCEEAKVAAFPSPPSGGYLGLWEPWMGLRMRGASE